ncbi:MAG: 2Fe-2S iron-sulfur cluster binding domain-containing protein [Nitrospira sp.]|nr:2Fe-2S iron-sulfur cluster binding domain-containing protein [Nitrospira sp.]MCA9464438.1 2Fe-2S iron-sulfur cluster binding domain-containing protein [Nitrospira sp.]MCA9474835.1 2Fe-2S iron-sulfur cluster binding domain-containing protein [Nitrospira sp.]MCA9479120.1 2Fe-2S iron-sulfur cluster binding domain-containing protein [Nitrospira sp.]MDR4489021.1 2Fe-2S iron-sulfur cluster-binding protein [Nitrospirales bacterium]
MGGSNPYIEKSVLETAQSTFKVKFISSEQSIEITVDPSKIPYGETGLPGSILDIALGQGIDLEHACGGVCACSTCHIKVKEGLETCNEPTDDENDQLDEAPDLSLQSRLACQCVPNGTRNLIVEIPEWNKNLVKENH